MHIDPERAGDGRKKNKSVKRLCQQICHSGVVPITKEWQTVLFMKGGGKAIQAASGFSQSAKL